MTDRAAVLARLADEAMEHGGIPNGLPEGCTGVRAFLWPKFPGRPSEIRFSADWPGLTIVCSRSLDGYVLEGGLRRA